MFHTKDLQFQSFLSYPDVHIPKYKITCIYGESGCGKSTLLKLFNKTLPYTNGNIYYNDASLDTYESIALRKEVKLISQHAFLFTGTILENFEYFYSYCAYTPIASIDKMKYFLSLVGISLDVHSDCSTLSGGEKQRVYIAICLSMESKVLLLDEPTSALDNKSAQTLLVNLKKYVLENKLTCIIVSHDIALMRCFADSFIHLKRGDSNE